MSFDAALASQLRTMEPETVEDKKAMLNKVLFETKADYRTDWAKKRDEERMRKQAEA